MFSTKKAKNTVSEILADFQLKVTELRQLAERKVEEVQTTQIQITTLETAKASAQAEAVKANKAASIIGTTIVFEDGTKYEYKDESIYRNDKKIAKNIRTASFEPATYTVNNVTKNLIKVNLNIGVEKKSYQKQIEYVLKYW